MIFLEKYLVHSKHFNIHFSYFVGIQLKGINHLKGLQRTFLFGIEEEF